MTLARYSTAKEMAPPPQTSFHQRPASAQLGLDAIPHAQKLMKPRMVSKKSVAWWLLGSAAAVFGIVILGGLTRLTESGLSITEWKPVTGSIPPITQEDWEKEFALYRESPEFRELNSNITLEEYKFIYYMEWGHRLWGRAIGLLVLLPGAYFVARRYTSPQTNRWLLAISGLLGLQGFVGWWMVKSGLDQENLDARPDSQPRVSQYRLATHLGLAFLVYFSMTWSGLSILREHEMINKPVEAVKQLTVLKSALATPMRRFSIAVFLLAALTSLSGAFVAGLDAGMLYNSFPLMGKGLVPPTSELLDVDLLRRQGILNPSKFEVWYKNMLENPVAVQLNHRILAVTLWTLSLGLQIYAKRNAAMLPRKVVRGAHGVFGFATLQAALGITTLIYVVPIPVAVLHQAGALALLTSILVLLNRQHIPRAQIRKLLELMAAKANQAAPQIPMPA